MTLPNNNKIKCIYTVLVCVGLLSACQPQRDAVSTSEDSAGLAVVQAKVRPLSLPRPVVCDEQNCTKYRLYSVNTNLPWINQYFDERIKKANPVAFEQEKSSTQLPNAREWSETLADVRYVAQRGKYADFVLMNYHYPAGAAHGMYHQEYITFDLVSKKRIALDDLVIGQTESKLLDALYRSNQTWLADHNITREQLKVTDNYYFGAKGVVFVYPLYELGSYAEGLSELVLPYQETKGLIKSEYLPSFVDYSAEREKTVQEKS